MKFELDTDNKTITLKENVTFEELQKVVIDFDLQDWTILTSSTESTVYTYPYNPPLPYPVGPGYFDYFKDLGKPSC